MLYFLPLTFSVFWLTSASHTRNIPPMWSSLEITCVRYTSPQPLILVPYSTSGYGRCVDKCFGGAQDNVRDLLHCCNLVPVILILALLVDIPVSILAL